MSRVNRTTDYFFAGLDRGTAAAARVRQNRIQDEELKYVRERRAVTDARDDSEYQYLTGRRAVLDKRADDKAAFDALYDDVRMETAETNLSMLQQQVEDMQRARVENLLTQAQTKKYNRAALDFLMRPEPDTAGMMDAMRANLGADPNFTGPPAAMAGQPGQQQQNATQIIREGVRGINRPELVDEFFAEFPEAVGKVSPQLVSLMVGKDKKLAQKRITELQLTIADLAKQNALQFAEEVVDEADALGLPIDDELRPFADRQRRAAEDQQAKEDMLLAMGVTPDDPRFAYQMQFSREYIETLFDRTAKVMEAEAKQARVQDQRAELGYAIAAFESGQDLNPDQLGLLQQSGYLKSATESQGKAVEQDKKDLRSALSVLIARRDDLSKRLKGKINPATFGVKDEVSGRRWHDWRNDDADQVELDASELKNTEDQIKAVQAQLLAVYKGAGAKGANLNLQSAAEQGMTMDDFGTQLEQQLTADLGRPPTEDELRQAFEQITGGG